MSRIIIAFSHNASREKIGQLVEQCGYALRASCRCGADAIRAVNQMGGGIVICGYKLADMTADELMENLGSAVQTMVVASPIHLDMVENAAAVRVASPISRMQFKQALEQLLELEIAQVRARGSQRSPEELALINHAKAILISRGMTEAQAHSTLQQRSMRNRCKLTETAQQVIAAYEINPH